MWPFALDNFMAPKPNSCHQTTHISEIEQESADSERNMEQALKAFFAKVVIGLIGS